MIERELVHLRHSHDNLRGVARDLGFNAVGLLRTHAYDDPNLCTGFGNCSRLCLIAWAMFDLLVFFFTYFVSTHELCS